MARSTDSYCNFSPLKLGIFTWNVDGQNPDQLESSGPVDKELLGSFLTSLKAPDLIVFNFQEVRRTLSQTMHERRELTHRPSSSST